MRGPDLQQHELFSDKTLEERVPVDHPPRLVLVLVNGILNGMDAEFDGLYSAIAPTLDPAGVVAAGVAAANLLPRA
jgi:hypothetical protein